MSDEIIMLDEFNAEKSATILTDLQKSILLDATIEQLGLSIRAYNTLKKANIHFVSDLVQLTMEDLILHIKLGKKSCHEVTEKLAEIGFPLDESLVRSVPIEELKASATKYDWQCNKLSKISKSFYLEMPLNKTELSGLKRGNVPSCMEEKWFFYYESGVLNLYRSWTGIGVYRIILNVKPGIHLVTAYYSDEEHIKSLDLEKEHLKQLLNALIKKYVFGQWF